MGLQIPIEEGPRPAQPVKPREAFWCADRDEPAGRRNAKRACSPLRLSSGERERSPTGLAA